MAPTDFHNVTPIEPTPKISIITSLYRAERYLGPFLEWYKEQFDDPRYELILVHNDPTTAEESMLSSRRDPGSPDYLAGMHYVSVPREPVYASWNRGMRLASADLLTVWNVDDVRTREGIDAQIERLERGDVDVATGDYMKVFRYGRKKGVLKRDSLGHSLFYGRPKFRNGCFLAWHKRVHERVGGFDEQFAVSGDREFWYRALSVFKAGRVEPLLGWYLREPGHGLSKSSGARQRCESALIMSRYACCYLAHVSAMRAARSFRRDQRLESGSWKPVEGARGFAGIRSLPGYLLFFVPWIRTLLVEGRFRLHRLFRGE